MDMGNLTLTSSAGQQLQVVHFYTFHSHSVLHIHQLETTLAYLYQHVHVNVLRPVSHGSVGPYERVSRCADIRSHTPHVTQDTGHSLVLHTHHGKDRCATASYIHVHTSLLPPKNTHVYNLKRHDKYGFQRKKIVPTWFAHVYNLNMTKSFRHIIPWN